MRPLRELEPQIDASGGDCGQPVELALEGARKLGRRFDEREVAAARFGHGRKEPFVEVVSHAERGGRDTAFAKLGGMPDERGNGGLPLIRQSIGQHDSAAHAIGRVRRFVPGKLAAPHEPATAKIGRAACRHAAKRLPQVVALPCVHIAKPVQEIDVIVEHHQCGAIALIEHPDGLADRLFGELDRSSRHRSRTVDDERKIDRRPQSP